MRKFLISILITIALIITAWVIWSPASNTTSDAPTAPDFTFKDINGAPHKLSDFKGKPVILHFWASWCAPCVVELPNLVKLAQNEQDKLVVIAISSDLSEANLKTFLKRHKIKMTDNIYFAWDENNKITQDLYQTLALPESIILSPSQTMDQKIAGEGKWLDEPFRKENLPFLFSQK